MVLEVGVVLAVSVRFGPSPSAMRERELNLPSASRFWSFWKRFMAAVESGSQVPEGSPVR